jgi:phospholipase A1/A2
MCVWSERSGRAWFNQAFMCRVPSLFHKPIRIKGGGGRLMNLKRVCRLVVAGVFVIGTSNGAYAAVVPDCSSIADPRERLRCYDTAGERRPAATATAGESLLDERLRQEREFDERKFLITLWRPNYLLHTYSKSPNEAPYRQVEPDARLQHQELKYQVSFRVRIVDEVFRNNGDLWFGYTQLSLWQAYNKQVSSPFRETNYEPEIGLSFNTDFQVFGWRHRLFSIGASHQSNGQSEPLSRSWNRVWANFVFERGNYVVMVTPWYRIPEAADDDDNPDIQNYVGRGEVRIIRKSEKHVYTLTARNNFRTEDNRGAVQLDWSFPVGKRVKGLVQYYHGYGESLIDYNVRTNRIGIGLLISDWL